MFRKVLCKVRWTEIHVAYLVKPSPEITWGADNVPTEQDSLEGGAGNCNLILCLIFLAWQYYKYFRGQMGNFKQKCSRESRNVGFCRNLKNCLQTARGKRWDVKTTVSDKWTKKETSSLEQNYPLSLVHPSVQLWPVSWKTNFYLIWACTCWALFARAAQLPS